MSTKTTVDHQLRMEIYPSWEQAWNVGDSVNHILATMAKVEKVLLEAGFTKTYPRPREKD